MYRITALALNSLGNISPPNAGPPSKIAPELISVKRYAKVIRHASVFSFPPHCFQQKKGRREEN
jgi:hypothetical protein